MPNLRELQAGLVDANFAELVCAAADVWTMCAFVQHVCANVSVCVVHAHVISSAVALLATR